VVREKIVAWIAQERLSPGETLPAEMRMCEMFGVSRITVRHAVQGLVQDGILTRRPGVGTFVSFPEGTDGGAARTAGLPNTVVLLISNTTGSFMLDLIAGVEAGVRALGMDLQLQISNDEHQRERLLMEQVISKRPAGVVLFPVDSNEVFHPNCFHYLKLVEAGIPVIFVDRYLSQLPIGFVVAGDEEGMRGLTEHMIAQGFEDVGYIDHAINASSVIGRRRGYEDALRHAGLTPGLRVTVHTPRSAGRGDIELGYEAVREALEKNAGTGKPVRALIACNSYYALGAFYALKDMGYKVPEDVALAGFEDVPEAVSLDTPLTSWRAPTAEIGETAAVALGRLIKNPKGPVPRLKIAGQVMARDSSQAVLQKKVGKRFGGA
jgi:DNA-binding LacI/PurR family transcriptional regulator